MRASDFSRFSTAFPHFWVPFSGLSHFGGGFILPFGPLLGSFCARKWLGLMEADPSLMLHNSKGADYRHFFAHFQATFRPLSGQLWADFRRGRAGEIVKMGGGGKTSDVFDFANPLSRALFIEECINATKSGFVDGELLRRPLFDHISVTFRSLSRHFSVTVLGGFGVWAFGTHCWNLARLLLRPGSGRHPDGQRQRSRALRWRELPLQAQ